LLAACGNFCGLSGAANGWAQVGKSLTINDIDGPLPEA